MKFALRLLLCSVFTGLVVSCSTTSEPTAVNPRTLDKSSPQYENPFDPVSHAHFVAGKDYPSTYGTYYNHDLLNKKGPKKQKVVISLDEQRGRYYIDNAVAIDFPLSTGVSKYPTPTGHFKIIEKKPDHTSNLYGRMYDAEGKCIDGDAKSSDPVPEGGKFAGSPMPYWMRLTGNGVGMHVGKVGRRPLSHGCIRLQKAVAKDLYARLPMKTSVTIQRAPEEILEVPVKPVTPVKKG